MPTPDSADVAREFWRLMATNDFHSVAAVLATVEQGKVIRLVEFWPEPYTAPMNRAHLVEVMP